MKPDIKSLTGPELGGCLQQWGQPAYRVGQILDWIYRRLATDWDEMSNLPKALREQLRENFSHYALEVVRKQGARDTTQKFLWRLQDHSLIESVLIPANPALYGDASDRHTLCISTQVGCAYGCKFCASGLDGWKRNLSVAEIVDQVLAVERWNVKQTPDTGSSTLDAGASPSEEPDAGEGDARIQNQSSRGQSPASRVVNNIVVMGMGEPLANYDNLLAALRILNAPWGGGIGARKITVSTSGLVPQIRRLADEPQQFRLAISLHGATDAVREKIMPVNRKYPLAQLADACDYYQQRKGRMITLEYILIAGVNDGIEQIQPLAGLAHRLNAKVNLIPYNTVEGLSWIRPEESVSEAFLSALEAQDVAATLRREKGHDIDAACGQLRLKTERELAAGPAI